MHFTFISFNEEHIFNVEKITCMSSEPVTTQFFLAMNRAHRTGKSHTCNRSMKIKTHNYAYFVGTIIKNTSLIDSPRSTEHTIVIIIRSIFVCVKHTDTHKSQTNWTPDTYLKIFEQLLILIVHNMNMSIIECTQHPWFRWMYINTFHTIGSRC